MQLKTITELLDIPNYKLAEELPSDNKEHIHYLLEQRGLLLTIKTGFDICYL